jgi:hypothetical protein
MANILNLLWVPSVGKAGAVSVPLSGLVSRGPVYEPFNAAGQTVAEGGVAEVEVELFATIQGSSTVAADIDFEYEGPVIELESTIAGSSTIAAVIDRDIDAPIVGALAGSATLAAVAFATTTFPPTEGRPITGQLWPR